MHLDNARSHNSRQPSDCLQATKVRRMARPAYGSDRAPSEFFLFGLTKRRIQGIYFPDREALKSAICRIFREIGQKVLASVFLDWIERFEWVFENDGE
jgi:hypothetical protein